MNTGPMENVREDPGSPGEKNRAGPADVAVIRQQIELQALFDLVPARILFKDTENNILRANKWMAETVGKSVEEVEGRSTGEIFPRDAARFYANDLEVIRSGKPRLGVVEAVRDRHDNERWIQTDEVPVFGRDGKVNGVVVMVQDITERRRDEQELKAAKLAAVVREDAQRYSFLADAVPVIIWAARPDGSLDYYNKAWFDYTGLAPGQTIDLVLHPDDFQRSLERWEHSVATGEDFGCEYRFRRGADGVYRWFMGRASARRNEEGEIVQWVGTCTDVDDQKRANSELERGVNERTSELVRTNAALQEENAERRRAEEALRASQQITEGIINAIPIRVFWKDKNLVYLGCNEVFARDAGFADPRDIIGKVDSQLGWRDQAESYSKDDRQVIASGDSRSLIEEPQTTPEGKTITLLTSKTPMRNSDGEIDGVLGTYIDITERKKAEEALRESEERFSGAFEYAPIGVALVTPDGRWLKVNRALCDLVGYSEAGLLAHTYQEMTCPDDLEASRENVRRLIAGESRSFRMEKRYIHARGHFITALTSVSLVRDGRGRPLYFIAQIQDLSERKLAETNLARTQGQLVDASRQAGMAEVATGVLHNISNVLNSVNVSATLVASQVRNTKAANVAKLAALLDGHKGDLVGFLTNDPRGRTIPGYLGSLAESLAAEQKMVATELRKNIDYIKGIVAMQQTYATASGVIEAVSVPDMIEDALQINAASLARHDIETIRDHQSPMVVTTDKHKVMQILINLVRNAKYACDESGRAGKQITIRTTSDVRGVKIAVIDNGVGIPAENLTRIFNYGFTTREHGHGFGLHSSALAAKELGGSLAVQSDGAGRGAVFTLELPCKPEAKIP
jgi:PAS domain S-box-containing protein